MTRRSTLCKYEDSMLAAMFSGRHQLDKDRNGALYQYSEPRLNNINNLKMKFFNLKKKTLRRYGFTNINELIADWK